MGRNGAGSDADEHSGDFLRFHFFAEAEGIIIFDLGRVYVGAEHHVPDAEGAGEVHAAMQCGGVMDAMVIGRDEEPVQRAEAEAPVGVFDKLDEQPDGIADASSREEPDEISWTAATFPMSGASNLTRPTARLSAASGPLSAFQR